MSSVAPTPLNGKSTQPAISDSSMSSENSDLLNPAFKEWSQLYSYIEYNPDSFSAWEDLIEITESLEGGLCKASSSSAIRLFRFTYDTFLKRFPLLHGYWIKYAEEEFRLGNTELALMIYDKAINILPLSVELWTKYCQLKRLVTPSIKQTRALFEKGVNCVGYHYLSHPFWDEYIKLEQDNSDILILAKLLLRIFQIPLHQYAKYYAHLVQLSPLIPVKHLVSPEYLEQFNAEYEIEQIEEEEEKSMLEGRDNHDNLKKVVLTKRQLEEKKRAAEIDLRNRIYTYYSRLYIETRKKVSERYGFESEIQRPYFHVVYLPEEEIANWRKYLQFVEVDVNSNNSIQYFGRPDLKASFSELIALYERVIIPFGHYEEFWLRYTKFLVANNMVEDARNVYRRAGFILPIGRIQVRLQYALFEESQGNLDSAKEIYKSVLDALPTSTELVVGYASLLHRSESAQAAITYLEQKVEDAKLEYLQTSTIPSGSDFPALAASLAKFYMEWLGSVTKARGVFSTLASSCPNSYYFWREYLRFEIDASENATFEDDESALFGNNNGTSHSAEAIKHSNKVTEVFALFREAAKLQPNEEKDLVHIYMVFLLSRGSIEAGAAIKYFDIDRDVFSL